MTDPTLQPIADSVLRRARQQGSVTARDIRAETKLAGLAETQWKDVAALVKAELHYRQGRYYPADPISARRAEAEAQQERVAKAIRALIREHRATVKQHERRGQTRIDFIQPIKVHTADGHTLNLLSRDVSTSGIRLVGTKQLLGQKVQIELPHGADGEALILNARILWTCAVGDDLFENGGSFLEITSPAESPYPKLV
jgi:chromosome condensin MukBEF ATPase and DNA-binding subunit MukB